MTTILILSGICNKRDVSIHIETMTITHTQNLYIKKIAGLLLIKSIGNQFVLCTQYIEENDRLYNEK